MVKIKNIDGFMIETDRLILRVFNNDDAADASYNSKQPSIAKEMSDMILETVDDAEKWINWLKDMLDFNMPWLVLAIENREDHRCIGIIGIIPQRKINNEMEILYSVADAYQGKGYATEAAKAIVNWYFNNTDNKYLAGIVKVENVASYKVLHNLGFNHIENREIEFDGEMREFSYYRLTN